MRIEQVPALPKPLPRVIVGAASMGSVLPPSLVSVSTRARAFAHLDELFAAGCTAFDTAAFYQAGGSERLLGEWLEARKNRDQLFLITKGAHPNPALPLSRFNPKAVTEDLHASLRRLRTDHVELYLLHRDDPKRPFEALVELLSRFHREGKIGAWGVSNWKVDRIQGAVEYARAHGLVPPAASSPHFSLLEWVHRPWPGTVSIAGDAAREARAFHQRTQLPVLAWSPLGRGFFGDRVHEGVRPGVIDIATRLMLRAYGSPANFARKRRAEELAKKHGVSAAQIALAWLFHQPFPVFAVVSASTAEKMKRNIAAAELELTQAEVAFVESGEPL